MRKKIKTNEKEKKKKEDEKGKTETQRIHGTAIVYVLDFCSCTGREPKRGGTSTRSADK
jgi:hypothetical protein